MDRGAGALTRRDPKQNVESILVVACQLSLFLTLETSNDMYRSLKICSPRQPILVDGKERK